MTADQKAAWRKKLKEAKSLHKANPSAVKPAGNGHVYYMRNGDPAFCFLYENADPGVKSCCKQNGGRPVPGHYYNQCPLNGSVNVASPRKNGTQRASPVGGAINSTVAAMGVKNSKGVVITDPAALEQHFQSMRENAENGVAPKKTPKGKPGKPGKAAQLQTAKVAALAEITKRMVARYDNDSDASSDEELNAIKQDLQSLMPVIVVNLQTTGARHSQLSCVVDFENFSKMLVDSGARHNVCSEKFAVWCEDNAFGVHRMAKDPAMRFEAASGDVMPYVFDLLVRMDVGSYSVLITFKVMKTMPAGHLPILGIRGQRKLGGDILNSLGIFRTCIHNETSDFQIQYGDGDWTPDQQLSGYRKLPANDSTCDQFPFPSPEMEQLEAEISELARQADDLRSLNQYVLDESQTGAAVNVSAVATVPKRVCRWENGMMVTALVAVSFMAV